MSKRGKESSDEDSPGGGDKGSAGRAGGDDDDEEEKGATPDGSSGDDEYRQVKSKRQKLKDKKKRQKAKKKEDALRPHLLLIPEEEKKRLWTLGVVKPSKHVIDQALAGHPDIHPQLTRLLDTADTFVPDFLKDGVDPAVSRPVLRQQMLSFTPFTLQAVCAAIDEYLTLQHGPPRVTRS